MKDLASLCRLANSLAGFMMIRTKTIIFTVFILSTGLVSSKDIPSKSVYFSKNSLLADKTICITNNALIADETICITNNVLIADETYFITEKPKNSDSVIQVVESSISADQTIHISSNSLIADKTICLTNNSLIADKTIGLTKNPIIADGKVCILNATPREKEIIIALMSLYIIVPDSKKSANKFDTNNIWTTFEETSIKGTISGSVKNGHIFQTISGNIYEVTDYVYLYEYEYSPSVIVLQKGSSYKLIIDGFDEPLLCKKINSGISNTKSKEVIESSIDGDFEGFEGETIIKLMNGQIWQQTEYYYHYHYAFMPKVLIYKSGSGYKMKVDGVDKAVGVIKLK
jgi:hypothetical protein